jgi:hypothetical protein
MLAVAVSTNYGLKLSFATGVYLRYLYRQFFVKSHERPDNYRPLSLLVLHLPSNAKYCSGAHNGCLRGTDRSPIHDACNTLCRCFTYTLAFLYIGALGASPFSHKEANRDLSHLGRQPPVVAHAARILVTRRAQLSARNRQFAFISSYTCNIDFNRLCVGLGAVVAGVPMLVAGVPVLVAGVPVLVVAGPAADLELLN